MPRVRKAVVLSILTVALGTVVATAATEENEPAAREYELENVRVPEAATVLRSIASAMQVEPIDDRWLRVTDTLENLEVVERVLQMIDFPSPGEDGFESFTLTSGDEVIAGIALRKVSAPAAMSALRNMRVRSVAVINDVLLILRDTPEQIDAVWELIQNMERTAQDMVQE